MGKQEGESRWWAHSKSSTVSYYTILAAPAPALFACLSLCICSEFEPQAFAFDNQIDQALALHALPFEHSGAWVRFGFMCIV